MKEKLKEQFRKLSGLIKTKEFESAWIDEPSSGLSAWVRTTAGVVAMLVALQFATGVLLTFYYVPSIESAHTTVAYIEKVAPAGSWIRALHHYGSALLPLFLFLHLMQMFLRETYRRKPVAWICCIVLLSLTFAAGGTGYTLAWDLNSFSSMNIAEGMVSGLPLVGGTARNFLLGGSEISALTLSRFFALHVFIIAGLILFTVVARFFILRENGQDGNAIASWKSKQLFRNAIVAGLVFLVLSLFALKYPATFGPTANVPSGEYLPRPGPQFLWLFQLLKYVPGDLASMVGAGLPPIFFGGLALLIFLKESLSRKLGRLLFVVAFLLIATMTSIAIISDRRDAKTREQLAKQKADEMAWRAKPFEPLQLGEKVSDDKKTNASNTSTPSRPDAYIKHCASCHGGQGQGKSVYPPLLNLEAKPRRSLEDMIALMNNPEAYNLKLPMKSFKDKLTDEEKRAIAVWILTLKK
jgi:ubiquinol-cytochrome c reductase cytochrome b subunit